MIQREQARPGRRRSARRVLRGSGERPLEHRQRRHLHRRQGRRHLLRFHCGTFTAEKQSALAVMRNTLCPMMHLPNCFWLTKLTGVAGSEYIIILIPKNILYLRRDSAFKF